MLNRKSKITNLMHIFMVCYIFRKYSNEFLIKFCENLQKTAIDIIKHNHTLKHTHIYRNNAMVLV